ncbi:hypothetical protein D3C87_1920910 [compost metagenome]
MLGTLLQQTVGDEEQALDSGPGVVRQRRVFFAEVHQVKRPFFANDQQITAQPRLKLAGASALSGVLRVEFLGAWGEFVQVFGNGRGF